MRITVLGCGYVGLVTGTCLAEIGNTVLCTDNDQSKIETLSRGGLPIYEPHLQDLVASNVAEQRLSFTSELAEAVRFGDVIFICVGTPPLQDGDADLSAIDGAARLIASEARSSKLVVEKSTVPMQTGQKLSRALGIYGRNSNWSFAVASNPEFLREGSAVLDFLHPDRVVIGVSDESAAKPSFARYTSRFCRSDCFAVRCTKARARRSSRRSFWLPASTVLSSSSMRAILFWR